jgi:hypothetical protein
LGPLSPIQATHAEGYHWHEGYLITHSQEPIKSWYLHGNNQVQHQRIQWKCQVELWTLGTQWKLRWYHDQPIQGIHGSKW